MILQELHKLALQQHLLEDTAFGLRSIHFVVRIDREGAFKALESMLDDRGRPRHFPAPIVPVRTVGIAPAFLVDNAQYTLALAKDNKQDNANARASAFDALVREAALATHDEGLEALVKFLARRGDFRAAIQAAAPKRTARDGSVLGDWEWTGARPCLRSRARGRARRSADRRAGMVASQAKR